MRLPVALRAASAAALTLLLVLPVHAFAADATTTDLGEKTPLNLPAGETTKAASSGGGGSIVRTIVGLAIVIAVIYGLAWVLRQVKSSREEKGRGSGLSTAAVVPLGPGRSLHLVRAGRELVLVGVAEGGVVPIRTYTEEEARALGLDIPDEVAPTEGTGPPSNLIDRIREWTVRR